MSICYDPSDCFLSQHKSVYRCVRDVLHSTSPPCHDGSEDTLCSHHYSECCGLREILSVIGLVGVIGDGAVRVYNPPSESLMIQLSTR